MIKDVHRSLAGKLVKIQSIHKKRTMYMAVWKKHLGKFRLYIVRAVRGSLTKRLMKLLEKEVHGSLEETLRKIQTVYSERCTWQFDGKTYEIKNISSHF